MTFDFRASQLRTSKIIASGSTGTRAKILLYPIDSQGTPLNQGNINTSLFGTGSIGNDVFFFVSGVIGGIGASTNGISLFGGDVYSSGNLKVERNLTVGSFFSQGNIAFGDATAFSGSLSSSLTAHRVWRLPDASGDLLITSRVLAGPNITVNSYSNGYVAVSSSVTSSVPTFTQVYSASTTTHEGSTFTATNGLGIATASTLTLSLSASIVSNTWTNNPHLLKNAISDVWNCDIRARLAAVSGADANTYLPLSIRNSNGHNLILIQTQGNGNITVYDSGGGSYVVGVSITIANSDNWFRLTTREGHLTVYLGTGSLGSQLWTPIYRVASFTTPSNPWTYTYIGFNLYQAIGAGSNISVQWADVQSTNLT